MEVQGDSDCTVRRIVTNSMLRVLLSRMQVKVDTVPDTVPDTRAVSMCTEWVVNSVENAKKRVQKQRLLPMDMVQRPGEYKRV